MDDRRLHDIEVLLGDLLRSNYLLLEQGHQIMIDTSKALAAVTQLTTDNGSLRALLQQVSQAAATLSQQLATAISNQNGAIDPATATSIQNDLNTIASLANTEDTAVKQALSANVVPAAATAPAAPGAPPMPPPNPAPASTAQPINTTQNPS
jgi:hypothetical protein